MINQLEIRIKELEIELAEAKAMNETAKKEADLEQERLRQQILTILDSLEEVIYVTDMETYQVLYTNAYLKNALGQDVTGKICYQALQGLDSPCDFCTNDIILKLNGQPYHWEYHNPIIKRDYQLIDKTISWLDGRLVRLEVAVDVTKFKQTERALQEQEKWYKAALNTTNDGFWDWDVTTGETKFSDRYYTMLGYEPGDFPSSFASWEKLLHPEDLPIAKQHVEDYFKGQIPEYKVDFRARTKDGGWRWIEARGEVVDRDEAGNILKMMGVHIDITAQKEVVESQRRTIQELSTPIIPIMDGIIVMPLIGSLDSRRAQDTMRTLLKGIREQRARVVILDITGVPIVDTGVAAHLDKTIQAARLKGARVIVTGISDSVAESIVDLGIDWHSVETLRDLQTGLVVALKSLGMKLS